MRLRCDAPASANLTSGDLSGNDNHFFIQDLPRLSKPLEGPKTEFETDLHKHLKALGVPEAFRWSIKRQFDYSGVQVHLITSKPQTSYEASEACNHGLLRLWRLVKDLNLKLARRAYWNQLELEICTASVGALKARSLDGFFACATGQRNLKVAGSDLESVSKQLRVVFPSVDDVEESEKDAQRVSNPHEALKCRVH